MERTETTTFGPRHEIAGGYVDWAAILGGAVVAAASAGMFATFGAALGLSTISAEPGEGSFNAWLIVTGLWLVISMVASFLAGGYVVGRMRRRVDAAESDEVSARDGINGLVVWGLGMILTAWLALSVGATATVGLGNVAGGVAQAAGATVSGEAEDGAVAWLTDSLTRPSFGNTQTVPSSGNADTAVAPGAPEPGTIDGGSGTPPATQLPGTPALPPAGASAETEELTRQSGSILANIVRSGEISDEDRSWLSAATARTTGLGVTEAEARVEQAVTAAQQARMDAQQAMEQVETAARDAAEVARKGAILTAFVITAAALVAGAAAMAGAVRGGRHRDEGRVFAGLSYRI
jgi:hypothetical protein